MKTDLFCVALAVTMLLNLVFIYGELSGIHKEMAAWSRSPVCEWSMKFIEKQEGKNSD